jgi:HK97 gp10 family phage protein
MPSGFSLEISGIQQLATYASSLATQIKPKVTEEITTVFNAAANRMRSDCPVRTGRLKKSIAVNSGGGNGDNILVQINIPTGYAGFVNFGTHRMKPRPFASNGYNYILETLKTISFIK